MFELAGEMANVREFSRILQEGTEADITLTKTEMTGMAAAAAVQIEGEIAEIRRLARLCSTWAADPEIGAAYGKIAMLGNTLAQLAARVKKANATSWAIVDGRAEMIPGLSNGDDDEDDFEFDAEPYTSATERSGDEAD